MVVLKAGKVTRQAWEPQMWEFWAFSRSVVGFLSENFSKALQTIFFKFTNLAAAGYCNQFHLSILDLQGSDHPCIKPSGLCTCTAPWRKRRGCTWTVQYMPMDCTWSLTTMKERKLAVGRARLLLHQSLQGRANLGRVRYVWGNICPWTRINENFRGSPHLSIYDGPRQYYQNGGIHGIYLEPNKGGQGIYFNLCYEIRL